MKIVVVYLVNINDYKVFAKSWSFIKTNNVIFRYPISNLSFKRFWSPEFLTWPTSCYMYGSAFVFVHGLSCIVPPVTRVVHSHVLLKNYWANLDQIQSVVEGDKYLIFHDPFSQEEVSYGRLHSWLNPCAHLASRLFVNLFSKLKSVICQNEYFTITQYRL